MLYEDWLEVEVVDVVVSLGRESEHKSWLVRWSSESKHTPKVKLLQAEMRRARTHSVTHDQAILAKPSVKEIIAVDEYYSTYSLPH